MRRVSAGIGLAALSAGLLTACVPPHGRAALAWVALVPLLVIAEREPAWRVYLFGTFAGALAILGVFAWIWSVPGFNLLDGALLSLSLGQYLALWTVGVCVLRRRTSLPASLVAPPLWVVVEYARGHVGFLSLPWLLLGDSQHSHPSLVQVAGLTGVHGVGAMVVFANAALVDALGSRPRRRAFRALPVAAALLLVAGAETYGRVVLARPVEGPTLRVAVVRSAMSQKQRWDPRVRVATVERYAALTREVAAQRPALVAWPETAVPGDLTHDPTLRPMVARLASEMRVHILAGSSERGKFSNPNAGSRSYNSLVLFNPAGAVAGEYRKLALVPFAEYTPMRDLVRWPRAITATTGDDLAGEDVTVFSVDGAPIGGTICWENIFPELVRGFVARGARVLVNATNEAWVDHPAASAQFLAMSRMRAAEHRIAIARATNAGIAAIIDPAGRVVASLAGSEGVLVADMPVATGTTFYTRHGDVFVLTQAVAVLGLAVAAVRRRAVPAPERHASAALS